MGDRLALLPDLIDFFVPLLIGTGGNAGSQTVGTIIRGLALGEIQRTDTWRVLLPRVAHRPAAGRPARRDRLRLHLVCTATRRSRR